MTDVIRAITLVDPILVRAQVEPAPQGQWTGAEAVWLHFPAGKAGLISQLVRHEWTRALPVSY